MKWEWLVGKKYRLFHDCKSFLESASSGLRWYCTILHFCTGLIFKTQLLRAFLEAIFFPQEYTIRPHIDTNIHTQSILLSKELSWPAQLCYYCYFLPFWDKVKLAPTSRGLSSISFFHTYNLVHCKNSCLVFCFFLLLLSHLHGDSTNTDHSRVTWPYFINQTTCQNSVKEKIEY